MPAAPKPLVLYSCVTALACQINEAFYGDRHYVWCGPHFYSRHARAKGLNAPRSACAGDIYHELLEDIESEDQHSAKIESNRSGILRGASIHRKKGLITRAQEKSIYTQVMSAGFQAFRPLICVIPASTVARLLRAVPAPKRAHPNSAEWIIPKLPRQNFDLIELVRPR